MKGAEVCLASTTWKLSHRDNFQRCKDLEKVLGTRQYTSEKEGYNNCKFNIQSFKYNHSFDK